MTTPPPQYNTQTRTRLLTFSTNSGNASQILEDYFTSIGGRENLNEAAKALKSKKRGRPSSSTPTPGNVKRSRRNGTHPADTDPPASQRSVEFKPPAGSWENHVDVVDMYREENGALMVYLTWKTGEKTHHPAKQAYNRCPQKVPSLALLCLSLTTVRVVSRHVLTSITDTPFLRVENQLQNIAPRVPNTSELPTPPRSH